MRRFSSFAGKGSGIAIFFLLVTAAALYAQEDSTFHRRPLFPTRKPSPKTIRFR